MNSVLFFKNFKFQITNIKLTHSWRPLVWVRFLAPLWFISMQVLGQDVSELEKRNGFKDIKLGVVVDSLKGVKFKKEFKEKDEFPAKLYSIDHGDYERVGEVKVHKVEVKAYKDLVYEILVITEKDTRLMKALESLYGIPDYDMKKETYFWKAETVLLKFRSHSKNQLELVYISYPIMKKMKADKNQKVDDIANDF